MNTNESAKSAPDKGVSEGGSADAVRETRESGSSSISGAVSSANSAIRDEAGKLAGEAQKTAVSKMDEAKEAANSHLGSFAEALRAASGELEKNHTGPAAELVSHAASGLETLSRSIDGKSSGDMLNAVRQFGRDNPLGFIAGSILAGFALGRVAATASSSPSTGGNTHEAVSPDAGVQEVSS